MHFKLFGPSGLRVSELCLGAMTFGTEWGWGAPKEESRKIFDAYADAGGNFVDTADLYTNGASETMIGEFVRGRRERFVIATKYSFNARPGDPNAGGNHRKNLVRALEGSLRRLGVDHIDLYWVHAWDGLTPVEETLRALDDQVRAGKILYAGISNAPAWLVARGNALAGFRGWTPFAGLQVEYSLIERTAERELLPMSEALGLGVAAWSPLASGLLTGKYGEGAQVGDKRLDKSDFVTLSERNVAIANEVVSIGGELGRSAAQVALNWVRSRRNVIPIIGARTLRQVRDNLACLEFTLPEAALHRLEEASRIDLGYPHDFLARKSVREFLHGGTLPRIDR